MHYYYIRACDRVNVAEGRTYCVRVKDGFSHLGVKTEEKKSY